MPGWQSIYEELKDQNFELISVAEDTGGEAAAGPFFDKAHATFTQIVDENHVISTLYNMVNVPTGVWIDENGVIVRPNETAYSSNTELTIGGKKLAARGSDYVMALRDWVAKGSDSEFVMTPEEITKRIAPRDDKDSRAEAEFQLGVWFHKQGNEEQANVHWQAAQELRPESWNYHRQDWSFTPKEAGKNWMNKFRSMEEDEEYYPELEIPVQSG